MDVQSLSAIDQIASACGFVSEKVVSRDVSWDSTDPDTGETKRVNVTVHYADLPAGDVRDIFRSDEVGRDQRFITKILRNADGSAGITLEQAHKLRAQALAALVEAGLDVIGMSDKAKKTAKKT